MKILHYLSLSNIGGTGKQFYRYLKFERKFLNHYNEHRIIIRRYWDDFYNDLKSDVKEYFLPRYLLKTIPIPKFFRKYHLKSWLSKKARQQNDIIFIHNHRSYDYIAKELERLSGKILFHEHGVVWQTGIREMANFIREKAFFIANSRATKLMLTKKIRVDSKNIEVVPNAITEPEKLTSIEKERFLVETRSKCEIPDDHKIGIFVGRLNPTKGIWSILNAIGKLKTAKITFLIIGSSSEEKTFKNYVRQNSISNVRFLGLQRKPGKYYQIADLALFPSIHESFGNVLLEAGIYKTPIICSKVDGMQEVVPDDNYGYTVEPDLNISSVPKEMLPPENLPEYVVDSNYSLNSPRVVSPEKIAERVREILKNPNEANKRAENMYKRVKSEYSMKNYVERLNDIYEKIIQ